MVSFEKRFIDNPDEAIQIVKNRIRLMGKIAVDCCFYKLMPDGETRLIRRVMRKPIFKGRSIYVRLDGRLAKCTLDITVCKCGDKQTECYALIPLDY